MLQGGLDESHRQAAVLLALLAQRWVRDDDRVGTEDLRNPPRREIEQLVESSVIAVDDVAGIDASARALERLGHAAITCGALPHPAPGEVDVLAQRVDHPIRRRIEIVRGTRITHAVVVLTHGPAPVAEIRFGPSFVLTAARSRYVSGARECAICQNGDVIAREPDDF
jgi:hypothetical protein